MFLKYFYDKHFAHASYMVGCQRSGTAIVVDPGRDIAEYMFAARAEGLRITSVAETHIHADYVSGVREFAEITDAELFLSDEGPAEWKYEFAKQYTHTLLRHGQRFNIGHIEFEVIHTPGHTPESISLMLTDRGGGATEPMGLFSGDFVFVGAIGRPDLLEEVVGQKEAAADGARELYASLQRFKRLPDFLQVWPAHGAGSACGKGLGAVPSSTVGYEKRFNPALQFDAEEQFIHYVLEDQPEAPHYFSIMKKVNKLGPALLDNLAAIPVMQADQLAEALAVGTVVDIGSTRLFQSMHVRQSINIPEQMLANWAGWLLDYSKPLYLIAGADVSADSSEAVKILRKMGVDNISGIFNRKALLAVETNQSSYNGISPQQAAELVRSNEAVIVDVRGEAERQDIGHIDGAVPVFLGNLRNELDALPNDRTIITQCASGVRSAVAASIIAATGRQVLNLDGGYNAWHRAGLS